jgi:hypothetical protein
MSKLFEFQKQAAYTTDLGAAYCGDSLQLLAQLPDNSVNLVMTSPPFALQRQKEYGNKEQHEYIDWLIEFAALVHAKLRPDGSFVLDLGGAYTRYLRRRTHPPRKSGREGRHWQASHYEVSGLVVRGRMARIRPSERMR